MVLGIQRAEESTILEMGINNARDSTEIFLFGLPHILVNGDEIHLKRRKSLALIAYLAVSRHFQSREHLANLLWSQLSDKRAFQGLRNLLLDIRSTPIADLLYTEGDQITLDRSLPTDVEQFDAQVKHIRQQQAQGRALSLEQVAALEAEVQFYDTGFLSDFRVNASREFDDWQFFHAQHYEEGFLSLLKALVVAYSERRMLDCAYDAIQRWLAIDPLAEQAHCRLMRLYVQSGDPDQALHQYHTYIRSLERQDELSATGEAQRFYTQILHHAPDISDERDGVQRNEGETEGTDRGV